MRKITVIFLATILMAGCATQGRFNSGSIFDSSRAVLDECDDRGGTHTILFYGNDHIRTAGVVHLKKGEIFAIRLNPTNNANNRPGVDYEDETVTISGKNDASAFLTANGSYATTPGPLHELIICVPPDLASGTYYYEIDITQTGNLDPRADVM
jgi:hypothetical protein